MEVSGLCPEGFAIRSHFVLLGKEVEGGENVSGDCLGTV